MTISANFPNVQPSLLLDFANAKQLPPSVNFTRATNATYYDGSTTAMAEQNLMLYSQEFENAYYTTNFVSVTANSSTAPDGTSTADLVFPNTTGTDRVIGRSTVSTIIGSAYTISVYAKASGLNFIYFLTYLGGSSPSTCAFFDLSTGAVGQTGSGFTSASIVSVGSGWYRCTATANATIADSFPYIGVSDANNSGTATASGSNGVLLWGFQFEQRSSATAYTATTTQAITNYIPVLLTAGGGQPRFDHNPTTSESLGLLIEEQRTNVLPYSSDYSDASWGKTAITVQSNVVVAPDGTLTGDKLVANTTNTQHYIARSVSITGGVTYTWSAYAKQGEYVGFQLNRLDVGGVAASFNLSTGAVISASGGTASMQSVGNGWYRCIFVFTPPGTTSMSAGLQPINPSGGGANFAGNDFSGVYVWGAQFETGSFPTSYIPTSGAAATRAADLATMTGVNFSSWFNNGQGTFVTQFMMPSPTGQLRRLWDIENTNTSTYTNLMAFNGYSGSNSNMYFEGTNGSSTQFAIDTGSFAANTSYRVAMAYQVNDFATSTSGGTVQTDTTGTLPLGLNALWLGSHRDGLWYSGYINKFAYYPVRVTNAQLQALSS